MCTAKRSVIVGDRGCGGLSKVLEGVGNVDFDGDESEACASS